MSLSDEEARDLLLKIVEQDTDLQENIRLYFSTKKLTKRDFKRMSKELDKICSPYNPFEICTYEYTDDEHEEKLKQVIKKFLSVNIPILLKHNCAWEAFSLVQQGYDFFAADEDFEYYDIGDQILDIFPKWWKRIITKASAADTRKIHQCFEQMLNLHEEFHDSYYVYSKQILLHDFHDEKSLKWALNWVNTYLEENSTDNVAEECINEAYGDYVADKIRLMKELNYSVETIQQYIQQYYSYPQIRQLLAKEYEEQGKYDQAIHVLEESKRIDKDDSSLGAEYSWSLTKIYQRLQDKEHYKQELWYYITVSKSLPTQVILQYKDLCSKEEWLQRREQLLKSDNCQYIQADFFAEEKLYKELLHCISTKYLEKQVRELAKYEDVLKPVYPKKIRDKYLSFAKKSIARAGNRSAYHTCVGYLKKASTYPEGKEKAQQLADKWREEFPRRLTLKDELAKGGF